MAQRVISVLSGHNTPAGIKDSKDKMKAYMTVFGGFLYMMVSIFVNSLPLLCKELVAPI